jgi:hypothetical protein
MRVFESEAKKLEMKTLEALRPKPKSATLRAIDARAQWERKRCKRRFEGGNG